MAFVSIYTVGRLNHPYNHPASLEFTQAGNEIIHQASKTGELIKVFSPDRVPIPDEAKNGKGYPVLTLTVWKSLQSIYQFTYSGLHKRALRDRSKWMEAYQEKHFPYVVWWSEMVRDVSWKEAFKRYNYYIENGSTAFAFDFKQAFDEKGVRCLVKQQDTN